MKRALRLIRYEADLATRHILVGREKPRRGGGKTGFPVSLLIFSSRNKS